MLIPFKAIDWRDNKIILLDQTLIPASEEYVAYDCVEPLIEAIRRLVVRGAPALGVAGAFGVVIVLDEAHRKNWSDDQREKALDALGNARPTAVNLGWAVEKIRKLISLGRDAVLEGAYQLAAEDKQSCIDMGNIGADWFIKTLGEKPLTFLTHCNTGSLGTTGTGTALGVIREMHNRGLVKEVYVDETRPLLQGSRLTAWELMKSNIPYRIEADGAAAMAILSGRIDAALIGADRITKNGDSANKIGSLSVALACHAAGIPFLVVAPESSVDRSLETGSEIHIEFRSDEELTYFKGVQVAPIGAKTFNPAFDITPAKYISAVITELKAYEISKGEAL